jgi:hypothetical protein
MPVQTNRSENENTNTLPASIVTPDDHQLAQNIISGVRGYGVTIQPNHSAAIAIAEHRQKHASPDTETVAAYLEALTIIAAGHGCPSALARDVLDRHKL